MNEEQSLSDQTTATTAKNTIDCKVVERQQGDGWTVLYRPGRHWERVTNENGFATVFPSKQEALDYVRDATPDAIISEVDAQRTAHAGRETKPRVDLIDPCFLIGLGRVLGAGSRKYSDNNWRYGSAYSERYASLQRHLLAWHDGETFDRESGENHLLHVATNAMILHYWQLAGRGTDDRSRLEDREEDLMTDLAKLEALAEAATPGPWSETEGWYVLDAHKTFVKQPQCEKDTQP